MKHFLVVHEVGHPIFHDHPEGSLLCPTISATQQLLTENFRQAARYLRVGAVVLGFHHDGCLYYCAASDEGENYPVLKRQLHLLRDVIAFFVADALSTGYARVAPTLSPALRPVVQTISHLARTRQSFLVQGIETLEVNRDLRDRCEDGLKAAWAHGPEAALHCLLFVNTKLVTVYSRPGAPNLSSADLFLLALYLESIVGAHLRPAASKGPPPLSPSVGSPAPAAAENGAAGLAGGEAVDSPSKRNLRGPADAPDGSSPTAAPTEETDAHQVPLPRTRLCFLRSPSPTPHEPLAVTVHVDRVFPGIYTVAILDCRPEHLDDDAHTHLNAVQAQVRDEMVGLRDFFVVKERTHFSIVPFVKIAPGLVHFVLVDRTNPKFPNRVVCPAISRLSTSDNRRMDDLPESPGLKNVQRLLWDCVTAAHEMQDAGYQETLRDLNGLQCHHKVWVEDEEAAEQPLDPGHAQTLATCPYAFRDRASTRRLRCYEFYALYLGAMSAQSVAAGSRQLICHLLDGQGKRGKD